MTTKSLELSELYTAIADRCNENDPNEQGRIKHYRAMADNVATRVASEEELDSYLATARGILSFDYNSPKNIAARKAAYKSDMKAGQAFAGYGVFVTLVFVLVMVASGIAVTLVHIALFAVILSICGASFVSMANGLKDADDPVKGDFTSKRQ